MELQPKCYQRLSDNHMNAYPVFASLPYEVTVDFSSPSWPPDRTLSVAGQKGLPSWKSVQPGLAILQLIAQSPSILDRNEETRCYVLYMLNFRGYENPINHSKLLGSMVSQKGTTNFCTLEELKAASKCGKKSKALELLKKRMARKVVERNEANTSAAPQDDDTPVIGAASFGDDEDGDSDAGSSKHADLFWSYPVWAKIKNKKDQDTVPRDDCYLQRALTACDEHEHGVLSVRAKAQLTHSSREPAPSATPQLPRPVVARTDAERERMIEELCPYNLVNFNKVRDGHPFEPCMKHEIGTDIVHLCKPWWLAHKDRKSVDCGGKWVKHWDTQRQCFVSHWRTSDVGSNLLLTERWNSGLYHLSPARSLFDMEEPDSKSSSVLLYLPWQEPQKKPLPSSAGLARLRRSKSASPKLEPAKEADLYEEQPLSNDLPDKPEARAPIPVFEPHIIATPSPNLTSPSRRTKAWLSLTIMESARLHQSSPAARILSPQDSKSPKSPPRSLRHSKGWSSSAFPSLA
ncbi:hypothetical protein LTR49_000088 [Elasticomyces elasticus]|nr:hypothetical protein LTR49_000088 [Elasticomyces elasticus]